MAKGWHQWLHLNLSSDTVGFLDWSNVWAISCHTLWSWRNKEIHDTSFVRPTLMKEVIEDRVQQYKTAMLIQKKVMANCQEKLSVQWSAPKTPFVKLNVDGARDSNGVAGCGGIIRDAHGMAVDLGFHNLEVETDSMLVVDCIKRGNYKNMAVGNLVANIIKLMQKFVSVDIKHIYREANNCANILDMEGRKLNGDIMFFTEAPAWMLNSLEKDKISVSVPRIIPV
ncbi:uncharacterized protein LOC131617392 [Vicia villosa]|uniref:uncharacterized protein LOC131617392 n=1 Tax=Vicia villosa TaxID=3911 RepID=UPI00273CD4E9|nr:uncharacterized protein LOC131617392 [Vicia villosa]